LNWRFRCGRSASKLLQVVRSFPQMSATSPSCPEKTQPTSAPGAATGNKAAALAPSVVVPAYGKARSVAAGVGVSTKTLFRWAEAGHISRFKLNARTVLFSPAEVAAYVRSCRVL
jgi:hypothetical protein